MDTGYTTRAASDLTGVSRQAIRVYTQRYAQFLSKGATPESGKERRFVADDLRVIKYVYSTISGESVTHNEVFNRLSAGALDTFDWQVPQPSSKVLPGPLAASGNVDMQAEQISVIQLILEDAQARERQAIEQTKVAQERIARLERELGKAEGEMAALRAQWSSLVSMFGQLDTAKQATEE